MAGRISKARRGSRNLPHLAGRLFGTPLLIDARKLDAIIPVFSRKLNGDDDIEPSADDAREPGEMIIDPTIGIAVIPVIGSLVRRPTFLDAWSGLTSYGEIAESLECALNDARVKAILLQVDSFGGEPGGCFELCQKIYDARAQKPVWAVADIDALSAGYAILSSAERCFAGPRGGTGSIGVVSVHVERSQLNAAMGITYTVFRAGERKADFNPYEKLSPAAAEKQMASMERIRQTFAETVSRNRPAISVQEILDTEGQWYDPEDALSLGLVDGVSTYDEVFAALVASVIAPSPVITIEAPEEPAAPIEEGETEGEIYHDPEDDPEGEKPKEGQSAMTDKPPVVAAGNKPPVVAAGNKPPQAPATAPAAPQAAPAVAEVVALDSARPAAETRALEIAQMCRLAGFPEKAPDFQLAGDTIEDVRTKLQTMRAEKDEKLGEISNQQPARNGGGFTVGQASPAALQSWAEPLKRAQATNPKFAAPVSGR
jgi:signal peptide peptidase SppA